MCLTLQGEQFPGGGGRVCRWGVDTAGKETSSMWEIYAISLPHGSDIEEAGSAGSTRVFTETPGRNRSNAGTSQTPAKVEKTVPGSGGASLS